LAKHNKKKKKSIPKTTNRSNISKGSKNGSKEERDSSTISILLNDKVLQLTIFFLLVLILLVNFQKFFKIYSLGFHFLILIGAMILLIFSSDRCLDDIRGLARKTGIPEIIIGLTIVSIGTSIPEIASTGMASYKAMVTDNPELSDYALGNIYGSVLVQITLVMGLVVLVRPIMISRGSVTRDGLSMIGAVVLLSIFVLWDMKLSRVEALILIALYGLFICYLYWNREKISREEKAIDKEEEEVKPGLPVGVHAIMMGLGLGLIIFSSDCLVLSAVEVAKGLGKPVGEIGLTISAVGTSLPELAIAIVAVKKARGLAIGTLIGSNVTDPMLSIGIAALINPVVVSSKWEWGFVHLIVPFTILSCVIGVLFMRTNWKIVRWEGATLVGVYIIFISLILYYI